MNETLETVTTKNGFHITVNDDAQIVIKFSTLHHRHGSITLEPIVISRADSLAIAQAVAAKRLAEEQAKEPPKP